MRRVLIVANQTVGSEALLEQLRARGSREACRLHVLVPATPPTEHLTWVEGEARAIAQRQLDGALLRFRGLGVEVTGEVGDGNPLLAIDDVLRRGEFDEIILSTFAPGISRWLRLDLPSRVASRSSIPVTHVIAVEEQLAGGVDGTWPTRGRRAAGF
jgi:GABA permease